MHPRAVALLLPLLALAARGQDVYFSPFDDPQSHAMQILDEATETLDIAQYNIRNVEYLEKLRQLRDRGVKIRIVVDKKNADQEWNTLDDQLEQEGFSIVRYLNTTRPLAIMHLKAVVIDHKTVMTGSFNWNETARYVNDENMLVLRDAALAQAYTREIDMLYGGPQVQGPHQSGKVEVRFSPQDNPRQAVIREIRRAKSRILVAMFTFADYAVSKELAKAVERGVEVVAVIEKKQAERFDADETVAAAVPPVGKKAPRVFVGGNISTAFSAMHQKYAVFDGQRVITGACNWTPTAFGGSNEDLLVIDDAALAAKYTENFGALVLRYAPEEFRAEEWGVDRADGVAHFAVSCDETQPGDTVYLIGSDPALGAWAPERAVPMATSSEMWPVWVANVRLARGAHVEWKLLIRGPSGDRWETGIANRELDAEPHGTNGAWLVHFDEAGRIAAPRGGAPSSTPGATPGSSGGIVGGLDDGN